MIENEEFRKIMLNSFLETTPDLVFFKDTELKYMGASKGFANMVGFQDEKELIGKTDFELFEKELATKYTKDDREILQSGQSIFELVEPIPEKNGKKGYSSTSKYILKNKQGNIIGIYGIGRDITIQMELEEERECRNLSREMFAGVLEADLTENKMIRTEDFNWCSKNIFSDDCTFVETIKMLSEKFTHKDYKEDFINRYSRSKLLSDYEGGKREFTHLIIQRLDGQEHKWMELTTRVYFSKITNTIRMITFFKDLDDEIRKEAELKIKAETDPLTGLFNRNTVVEKINECIKGYGKNQKHALLFIDLDYFKEINDNLGHPFGDKILNEIARKLRTLFRVDDIVGRVGGDEFLVFIKNVKSIDEVKRRSDKIIEAIHFSYSEKDIPVSVACSLGISIYDNPQKTLEILYKEADEAMYKAKDGGRNQLAFFSEKE